jgi:hypothetical protein
LARPTGDGEESPAPMQRSPPAPRRTHSARRSR